MSVHYHTNSMDCLFELVFLPFLNSQIFDFLKSGLSNESRPAVIMTPKKNKVVVPLECDIMPAVSEENNRNTRTITSVVLIKKYFAVICKYLQQCSLECVEIQKILRRENRHRPAVVLDEKCGIFFVFSCVVVLFVSVL
jgi:hypothetical protein